MQVPVWNETCWQHALDLHGRCQQKCLAISMFRNVPHYRALQDITYFVRSCLHPPLAVIATTPMHVNTC